jgi:hypothetical protein
MKVMHSSKWKNRRSKAEKREEDVSKRTSWPVKTGLIPGPPASVTKQPTMRNSTEELSPPTTPWRKREICYIFYSVTVISIINIIIIIIARLLARSQFPEGPATRRHGTGFSWFPCV